LFNFRCNRSNVQQIRYDTQEENVAAFEFTSQRRERETLLVTLSRFVTKGCWTFTYYLLRNLEEERDMAGDGSKTRSPRRYLKDESRFIWVFDLQNLALFLAVRPRAAAIHTEIRSETRVSRGRNSRRRRFDRVPPISTSRKLKPPAPPYLSPSRPLPLLPLPSIVGSCRSSSAERIDGTTRLGSGTTRLDSIRLGFLVEWKDTREKMTMTKRNGENDGRCEAIGKKPALAKGA